MNIDLCSQDARKLLTLEQARQNIQASLAPIDQSERASLTAALGRVLAFDVISPINLPRERNSAMDGYAFCSADLQASPPHTLFQVGTAWAGKPFNGIVRLGECVRIFTGAVLPEGADSVVIQEQVQIDGQHIHLPPNATAHQCVREIGEDLRIGDALLPAGKKLAAADLGLLAAAGLHDVAVIRRLKIAFFSTGDELVAAGEPLMSGQIYDSNRYILYGLLNDASHQFTDLGVVPDAPEPLERLLAASAALYDVIISTGGASVGDADYIQPALAHCGEVKFWKIAMKPGKPLAFGKIGACYFFGLPGNPVAVITTFQNVVNPALQQLAGMKPCSAWRFQATSLKGIKKAPGRIEFQRGILTQSEAGNFEVLPMASQGSHLLGAFSLANCYIILKATCNGVKAGENVMVEPFSTWHS